MYDYSCHAHVVHSYKSTRHRNISDAITPNRNTRDRKLRLAIRTLDCVVSFDVDDEILRIQCVASDNGSGLFLFGVLSDFFGHSPKYFEAYIYCTSHSGVTHNNLVRFN